MFNLFSQTLPDPVACMSTESKSRGRPFTGNSITGSMYRDRLLPLTPLVGDDIIRNTAFPVFGNAGTGVLRSW